MAISYVVKSRINPRNNAAPKRWYAIAKAQQELTFQKMCVRISEASSATKGDVQLALNGLIFQMIDTLSEGNMVRMGDFGSFRISLSGDAADVPEEFHSGLITKARIVFTPGSLIKDMLRAAKFREIEVNVPHEADPTPDPSPEL